MMARPKASSGLRKVLLGVGFVLVGVLVDSFSKNGLSNNLLNLLLYVFASFCAGNGIEHVAKAVQGAKGGAKVDTSQMENEIAQIKSAVTTNQQALGIILQHLPATPKKATDGNPS